MRKIIGEFKKLKANSFTLVELLVVSALSVFWRAWQFLRFKGVWTRQSRESMFRMLANLGSFSFLKPMTTTACIG
ncbi:MAG: hypothetical protein EBQ51_08715 [Verrucomicrobia bacterium]|nr:hypothetical protein [Verrucomicrobiota bacterium]